jgi:hypothetical protein
MKMALKYKYRTSAKDTESLAAYAKTMEKRATRQGGNFKGIIKDDCKTWRPAKGDNCVRILPPTWEDPDHYGIDVYVHYNVGPDKATVLCLNQMKHKPCPICQAKVRADREKDEDLAKQLAARSQTLVWMVDIKDKAKGPMVWAMAYTVERDIAKLSKDRQTGELYLLDHPDEGYNISFDRDGEGLHTKYSGWQLGRRPTSIEPEWLDYVMEYPLPECLVWRDYDEVKELFEGGSDDDKPEPEPAPRTRRKAAPEPEPEVEPEPEAKAEPETPWEEPKADPPPSRGKSNAEALRERFKR